MKTALRKTNVPELQKQVYNRSFFGYESIREDWIKTNTQKINPQATSDGLNELLYQDYYMGELSTLLRAEDRNSMRFSIESRVPFADSLELAKWAFSLPAGFKISPKGNKLLMRIGALKADYLTQDILKRKDKLGYATPSFKWLSEQKDDLLDYMTYIPNEIIDKKMLINKMNKILSTPVKSSEENLRLFKWITLGVWYKVFQNDN